MRRAICPECESGKHVNCDGHALDPVTDEIVSCDCPDCQVEQVGVIPMQKVDLDIVCGYREPYTSPVCIATPYHDGDHDFQPSDHYKETDAGE